MYPPRSLDQLRLRILRGDRLCTLPVLPPSTPSMAVTVPVLAVAGSTVPESFSVTAMVSFLVALAALATLVLVLIAARAAAAFTAGTRTARAGSSSVMFAPLLGKRTFHLTTPLPEGTSSTLETSECTEKLRRSSTIHRSMVMRMMRVSMARRSVTEAHFHHMAKSGRTPVRPTRSATVRSEMVMPSMMTPMASTTSATLV